MKSPDTLLADIRLISEERHSTMQAVIALAQRLFSPLTAAVKYGGILFTSDVQFGGVFAYKEHVSVEFGFGADIEAKQLAHYLPLALAAARARQA
jgi:hypothetical protein